MTQIKAPTCYKCKHFWEVDPTGLNCKAFPKGIPDRILKGYHKHKTSISGDQGIAFEELGDKDQLDVFIKANKD